MITKQEIVILFYESSQVVGMLVQNGDTTFYRVSKANKEHVAHLLQADTVEEK